MAHDQTNHLSLEDQMESTYYRTVLFDVGLMRGSRVEARYPLLCNDSQAVNVAIYTATQSPYSYVSFQFLTLPERSLRNVLPATYRRGIHLDVGVSFGGLYDELCVGQSLVML